MKANYVDLLCEAFGRIRNPATVQSFGSVMSGIDPLLIDKAAARWIDTKDKMPSPIQLKRLAQDIERESNPRAGQREPRAELMMICCTRCAEVHHIDYGCTPEKNSTLRKLKGLRNMKPTRENEQALSHYIASGAKE